MLALAAIAIGTPANAVNDGKERPAGEVTAPRTNLRPDPNAPKITLLPDDGTDKAGNSRTKPTGGTGFAESAAAASYLPFNFSYSFSSSVVSRTFWPSFSGGACVILRGTGSTDPSYWMKYVKVEMWDAYGLDTKKGATVTYSLDGGYYGYCWYGLNWSHEHYFRITKDWGPATVWGDGWAQE